MKYSFIICTLNRPNELEQAVRSILKQSYDNFEIIIVDQSLEKNEYIGLLDRRIRYFHSENKGLSRNRNIGISYAKGDYVCIMDDDATYTVDSLKSIDEIIEKTGSEMVGGIIMDPDNKLHYVAGSDKQKEGYITQNEVFSCCSSAALVILRELALRIKFDEQLGAGTRWGSGEEIDFILRALYENNKFYFSPNFVVFHPYSDKKIMGLEKANSYSLGYGALCAKHYYLFHNTYLKKRFYIALIKHIIALIVYKIKKDEYLKNFYFTSYKGKKEGFEEYKKVKVYKKSDEV